MRKSGLPVTGMIVALCLATLNSCVSDERDLYKEPVKIPKDQYFDFNMNQEVTVNIDYGFKSGNGYIILFDVYDQNPVAENADGTLQKKNIDPIYRAATDGDGKFNGKITIPSDLSEVWLSSDYLGTVSPVKLAVGDDRTLSFNQENYINSIKNRTKSRGITGNKHTYLDDWTVALGDWDNYGRPDYLLPTMNIPSASIFYSIKEAFKKGDGKNITNFHPEYFTGGMISDLKIIESTKINLVFINSSAGWNNTVGYFTYPTGTIPTKDNIKKILAFPNASPIYKTVGPGALTCGEQVQLKYWDGAKFVDEFPAGVTIGWCLQGMGFNDKNNANGSIGDIIKGMGIRFSTESLNDDKKQRTVSLRDPKSDQIVAIGFEDNIDRDYADAIFYIHIEKPGALDPGTLPVLPDPTEPSDNDNSVKYFGTLTFEDLWPSDGDYDMNDVMVDFTSTVYRGVLNNNRVFKIVDEFTPRHSGGSLINGFGYQLHSISPSDVRSIKIEGPEVSKYMEGQSMELGQPHPTILLFDNIKTVKGKKYTVTIELNDVTESSVIPPYNPFIFVDSDKERDREVHLVNYPPTDKANLSLFGTGKDTSRPEEKLYYVSKDMMPFAIYLPVKDFPIPDESVRIDEAYPKFKSWMQSNGTKDKDWYKKKK